jgi:uncharacterized membrane protein YdbT with pleckstrin-like domain
MNRPDVVKTVVVEATPAQAPRVAAPQAATAKIELLDGDEIIQVSLKPSLWFIPLVSFNVIVLVAFVAAALDLVWQTASTPHVATAIQVLAGLAALRVGIATLQWASRLYVLTNRRVMRFTGILNVHVTECRLARISAVDLHLRWYGRWLRLGSIHMRTEDTQRAVLAWDDVARPQELHELLVRAIRKAQSKE